MTTSEITLDNAVNWFQGLADRTPMPGARGMFQYALDALREKQEREDKEPCEGCKWEFNRSLGSADMCYNCNRMRKKDRYEPKGEQPCLK